MWPRKICIPLAWRHGAVACERILGRGRPKRGQRILVCNSISVLHFVVISVIPPRWWICQTTPSHLRSHALAEHQGNNCSISNVEWRDRMYLAGVASLLSVPLTGLPAEIAARGWVPDRATPEGEGFESYITLRHYHTKNLGPMGLRYVTAVTHFPPHEGPFCLFSQNYRTVQTWASWRLPLFLFLSLLSSDYVMISRPLSILSCRYY